MKSQWPKVWNHEKQRWVGGTAGAIKLISQDGGYQNHLAKFANYLHETGAIESFIQERTRAHQIKRVK